ncbi:hypothetical protein [Maribacter sp. HTCC2170]|uniref:hypothetical protein n=1 Tax=Maribacter sp. (strain HTCC2170 / KCCM 42371) TaxID=313603 RepID=UPI00006BB858|nr:hypothetical protein [Maribacter sp. HTCC2170]EAQ99699.1 hypothetical protein FB2170_10314 [Maribacter sp. HTCC2170]
MKLGLKFFCVIGLLFFVTSHILFSMASDFDFFLKPIDFAHWLNLIGASFLISFCFVFPKGKINSIASFLTILGVIGHIGMCTIDFIFWSFGDDYDGRSNLFQHLSKTPAIWYPFMIIGPSLLFAGLATHSWSFIKSHPIGSIMTLAGATLAGVANFIWDDRVYVTLSVVLFAIGLLLLLYRKEIKITSYNKA